MVEREAGGSGGSALIEILPAAENALFEKEELRRRE
jgi:hypothetical protein